MKAIKTPLLIILLAVLTSGIFSNLSFRHRLAEARDGVKVVTEGTVEGDGIAANLRTPDGTLVRLRMVCGGRSLDLDYDDLVNLEDGDYVVITSQIDFSQDIPGDDYDVIKV